MPQPSENCKDLLGLKQQDNCSSDVDSQTCHSHNGDSRFFFHSKLDGSGNITVPQCTKWASTNGRSSIEEVKDKVDMLFGSNKEWNRHFMALVI